MSLSGTPSPELEEANALVTKACVIVGEIFTPEPGRDLSLASRRAGLDLMREVLEANAAMDKADYPTVKRLLTWAEPEIEMHAIKWGRPVRVYSPLRARLGRI